MRRKAVVALLAAALTIALSGCLRQSAYYYIQSDDTVDGVIYIALHEDYITASDPYRGTGAGDIAAYFDNATIEPFDNGPWKGYHITFENEPLATFAGSPAESWQIQISKASNVYTVHGYTPTPDDDSVRTAIQDNDGFMQLTVSFPGKVVESTDKKEGSAPNETPGWVAWDQLSTTNAPYAKGNGGLIVFLIPGLIDLFDPEGDPVPNPPATDPESEPEPGPVVTVVVTPSPEPGAEPSASPSATVTADGDDAKSGGIPVWIWIVGAVLLAGAAGLGGVLIAQRGKAAPAMEAAAPDKG